MDSKIIMNSTIIMDNKIIMNSTIIMDSIMYQMIDRHNFLDAGPNQVIWISSYTR